MTLNQFRKMKVFAIRMARTHPDRRRRTQIVNHAQEILSHMDCENYSLHYSQIIDWDNSVDWTPEEIASDPSRRHYSKNRLMCDWVGSEYGEYDRTLTRQNPGPDGSYKTVLANHVACCIRAALDVAAAPSAGVLGFTVGDLRAMWRRRRLPRWVTGFFEGDITQEPDATPVWL